MDIIDVTNNIIDVATDFFAGNFFTFLINPITIKIKAAHKLTIVRIKKKNARPFPKVYDIPNSLFPYNL
ncbi:hypothetical protein LamDB_41610 [Bacillus anthracis]|uniref:Uncharacterized protein n=1 Tax=Bacillus anthracis TaxID=1392 RepID=A0A640MRQ7_BACAN|nr:peptidyl-prolyl cis-trans isomerase, cyclophilin-type domain protein [Bacillus anthracis]GAO67704.1 peptidyl-prolyl cis-trans isomerase, cyclophilin-type domain protein [Bacillus anthracis]GEU02857.1 hypothetical protein DB1_43810 [Bacillus anthracis]GEU07528.1 hypothetical protein HG1_30130 [Bacillus anthracis]GEU16069.1 hypothetical protein LamDB_41610 [Bacillus anthracis]